VLDFLVKFQLLMCLNDQGAESAATARYVTPKVATFIAGIYILHYYFKYNLGVSVHHFVVVILNGLLIS